MVFPSAQKMLPYLGIYTCIRNWAEAGICWLNHYPWLGEMGKNKMRRLKTNRGTNKTVRDIVCLPRWRRRCMWLVICTCRTAKSHFLEPVLLKQTYFANYNSKFRKLQIIIIIYQDLQIKCPLLLLVPTLRTES